MRQLIWSILIFMLGCGWAVAQAAGPVTVDAAQFGLTPGRDATPALRAALAACRTQGATVLRIPAGTYPCYPDFAEEQYCYIANNDPGLKRILLLIEGFDNLTIDATGAHFVCHGPMVPVVVKDSSNITLQGFSIDWERPFHFQGEVIATDPANRSFDLRVLDECLYELHHDQLVFRQKLSSPPDAWKQWPGPPAAALSWQQNLQWLMWFDAKTRQTWPYEERYRFEPNPRVQELSPGVVRLFVEMQNLPEVGMGLAVKGRREANRIAPAIQLAHSRELTVRDVTVHHAGGMGLVAQRCENVLLERFNVTLPEGSGRLVTTTADATHFNGCRGLIVLKDCVFENMLDDATNIHGCFVKVEAAPTTNTLLCRRIHSQQLGLVVAGPGDVVRLMNEETLQSYAELHVTAVRELNGDLCEITVREPLAGVLRPGSGVYNVTWQPDFTMEGCTVRNNRARTMLLSTAGHVEIRNNRFERSSMAGIQFEGGTGFWWESGPVRDVTIRDNTFVDIMGPVLTAVPDIDVNRFPEARYHGGIVFENNTIEAFRRPLMAARSVHGLIVRNNRIVQNRHYEDLTPDAPTFLLMASDGVELTGNTYEWDRPATVKCTNGTAAPVIENNQGIPQP